MQAYSVQFVEFGYPGREVFLELSLDIPGGGLTALVGNNGSGKSTLLSLLAGTEKPHSGSVQAFIPGRPALVVQHSAAADAFPITVRSVVAMGRWGRAGLFRRLTADDRRAVERAMERMAIADLGSRPLGELSGGQRQRALVAQGLAQEADVLLLDEPASGLDHQAQELIAHALLAETARGVTVVQATHDLDRARDADHCILLSGGHATAGAPRDILPADRHRFELAPDFP